MIVGLWIALNPGRGSWPLRLRLRQRWVSRLGLGRPYWVFALLVAGLNLLFAAALRSRWVVFAWLLGLQGLLGCLYFAGGLTATPFMPLPLRVPYQVGLQTQLLAQWWGLIVLAAFPAVAVLLDRTVVRASQPRVASRDVAQEEGLP